MPRFLLSFFLLCSFTGRAQMPPLVPGVFNAVALETDTLAGGWELTTNYYPLQGNINTRGSSVFIAEKLTIDQVEAALVKLPAHFFVLRRQEEAFSMIVLSEEPKRQYLVVDLSTGEATAFSYTLAGDLPEERVLELLDLGWEPNASRAGNTFIFNTKTFSILPAKDLKANVLHLIETQKLIKPIPVTGNR